MVYNPNIPQATDLISNSQVQILNNFSSIDSTLLGFARNHYSLTDATNGGLHKLVVFPNSPTPPVLTGTESAIYPKTVSGDQQLFFANAAGEVQMTVDSDAFWKGGSGDGVVTANAVQNGFMNLPNGVQFRWGYASGLGDSSVVSFTPAFSNNCLSIQVTGERLNSSVRSLWVNPGPPKNAFAIHTDASNIAIWYFAVGN